MVAGGLTPHGSPGFIGPVRISDASMLHSGEGVPDPGLADDGDYYFRNDAPDAANAFYLKVGGVWVPLGGGGGFTPAYGGMYMWDGGTNIGPFPGAYTITNWEDQFVSAGVTANLAAGTLTVTDAGVYELTWNVSAINAAAVWTPYNLYPRIDGAVIGNGVFWIITLNQSTGWRNASGNAIVAMGAGSVATLELGGAGTNVQWECSSFCLKRIG